ncbi:hypothetical protein LCGC14_2645140 [marine sediment metagenome]|uniref:Uncharacterized protein n=1 Tax=marine sediment metagenome TaxID=412755 RepID=A0A0F9AIR3_9ZZZZ
MNREKRATGKYLYKKGLLNGEGSRSLQDITDLLDQATKGGLTERGAGESGVKYIYEYTKRIL